MLARSARIFDPSDLALLEQIADYLPALLNERYRHCLGETAGSADRRRVSRCVPFVSVIGQKFLSAKIGIGSSELGPAIVQRAEAGGSRVGEASESLSGGSLRVAAQGLREGRHVAHTRVLG